MTELAPAGVGAAFGFAGAGAGEALAVASGFLIGVSSSGEATGSTVASAGVGAAFGFAGTGAGRPWPLLLAFWSVSVSQVRRLVPPSRLRHSPSLRLELPLTQVGTSSNTLHRLATTETSIR